MVFWFVGTFIAGVATLQVLYPNWTPPERGKPALILGTIVGLIMPWKRWLLRYHTIVVDSEWIELRRAIGSNLLHFDDVIGLIAQPSLNWRRMGQFADESEPLVTWQSLFVLTEFERYRLPFDRVMCPAIYDALRSVCPSAWGLPYPGELEAPEREKKARNRTDRTMTLERLRKFYQKQVIRNAALGVLLLLTGAIGFIATIAAVSLGKLETARGRDVVGLLLVTAAGALILKSTPRDMRVLSKIRQELG